MAFAPSKMPRLTYPSRKGLWWERAIGCSMYGGAVMSGYPAFTSPKCRSMASVDAKSSAVTSQSVTESEMGRSTAAQSPTNTTPDWSRGVLACFTEGNENRNFQRDFPTKQARQAHLTAFIGACFHNQTAAVAPLDFIEHNWASQPYTRGAYGPYWAPGVLSAFLPTWDALAHDNNGSSTMRHLWFAGGDYSWHSYGYIEGAIQTGYAAADKMGSALA